jgi:hypothetical protein
MATRTAYRFFPPLDPTADMACRLTKEAAAERREPPEAFFGSAVSQEPLPDGFELHFELAPGTEERVRTFIAEEQECCPFFAFETWREGSEVVVRILRPEGEPWRN